MEPQVPNLANNAPKVTPMAPTVAKTVLSPSNSTSNSSSVQKMQIKKISIGAPASHIVQKSLPAMIQHDQKIIPGDHKMAQVDQENIHERKPSSTSGADSGFESTKNYEPTNRQLRPAPPRYFEIIFYVFKCRGENP